MFTVWLIVEIFKKCLHSIWRLILIVKKVLPCQQNAKLSKRKFSIIVSFTIYNNKVNLTKSIHFLLPPFLVIIWCQSQCQGERLSVSLCHRMSALASICQILLIKLFAPHRAHSSAIQISDVGRILTILT